MQYNPDFVALRPILSEVDKSDLRALSGKYSLDRFLSSGRNVEEISVDFVYTSAKIEGNTYDRIDTDNLLRLGITAGGKRYSDAVMLLNMREAFNTALAPEHAKLDFDYLCGMHRILMRDLLPERECGNGRMDAVHIGATSYHPLADPAKLREEAKFIMSESARYEDPFERSIYLHCNLAYLQFFKDGNKRTARLMQTATLVQGGVLPLFFQDTLIDKYVRAVVGYYETGDYGAYVSFFKENYGNSIRDLIGERPRP